MFSLRGRGTELLNMTLKRLSHVISHSIKELNLKAVAGGGV